MLFYKLNFTSRANRQQLCACVAHEGGSCEAAWHEQPLPVLAVAQHHNLGHGNTARLLKQGEQQAGWGNNTPCGLHSPTLPKQKATVEMTPRTHHFSAVQSFSC